MTIDEAIEILKDLDTTLPQSPPEDRREAVKLGREALKRVKGNRMLPVIVYQPLLGETEEGRNELKRTDRKAVPPADS